jgi:hypothetical protein
MLHFFPEQSASKKQPDNSNGYYSQGRAETAWKLLKGSCDKACQNHNLFGMTHNLFFIETDVIGRDR